MTRHNYIFLLTILICGCNFSDNVEKKVEQGVKDATDKLIEDAKVAEEKFNSTLKTSSKHLNDTSFAKDLKLLSVTIDTVISDLILLDDSNPNSYKNVRSIFFSRQGDTLFNQLTKCYTNAINICQDNEKRQNIQSKANETLCNNNKDKFTTFFFGQSSPEMAIWILLGIKADIYNSSGLSIDTEEKTYR